MTKLGNPPRPEELAKIPPEVRILPVGTRLWRVYFRGGDHPTTWSTFRAYGPTSNRYDHHPPVLPEGPEVCRWVRREIYYAALDGITCLAEVFQASRVIDCSRDGPWLVSFIIAKPLELLNLAELWPVLRAPLR